MSRADAAKSEVAKALSRVQAIAEEALGEKDYAGLEKVAFIAGQLEAVLTGCLTTKTQISSPAKVASEASRFPSPRSKRKAVSKGNNRKEPAGEPTFYRGDNELIKIGSSKTGDGTYEHRAPYEVVERLVSQLGGARSSEELVRMDDVMAGLGKVSGREVPSYQAYLCLAWMRSEGLVEQHGRRGYTVPDPTGLQDAVEQTFKALQRRK